MKILLTEDNKVSRQLVLMMLNQLGYHVDIAINGEDAVRLWKQQHYDIIFMDIMMPIMNGYDATRMIRSYEEDSGKNDHSIIVAITAKKNKGEQEAAMKAGMDDYLTKPISEKMLKNVITKWSLPVKQAQSVKG